MLDIIIPTINTLEVLKNAIDSILKTTSDLNQLHIYVISDKSKYNYENLIQEYSKQVNISLIKSEKRIGPGPARNLGILAGKNPYITFLDADDEFQDDVLKYCDINYDIISTSVLSYDFIPHKIEITVPADRLMTGIHGLIVSRKLVNNFNLLFPNIKYGMEDTIFRCVSFSLSESKEYFQTSFYKDMDNPNSFFRYNNIGEFPYRLERNDEEYFKYEQNSNWLYYFYQHLNTLNLNKTIISSKNWNNTILTASFFVCDFIDVNCLLFIFLIINKYINLSQINYKNLDLQTLSVLVFVKKYLKFESDEYIIFYPKSLINDYNQFLNYLESSIPGDFQKLILSHFNHYQKKFYSIKTLFKECDFYYTNSKQKSDLF